MQSPLSFFQLSGKRNEHESEEKNEGKDGEEEVRMSFFFYENFDILCLVPLIFAFLQGVCLFFFSF